jgi:hypothetical protein
MTRKHRVLTLIAVYAIASIVAIVTVTGGTYYSGALAGTIIATWTMLFVAHCRGTYPKLRKKHSVVRALTLTLIAPLKDINSVVEGIIFKK